MAIASILFQNKQYPCNQKKYMNVTSFLDTATAVVKSREFKIVLIGLQLGFLVFHYLSAEKEKKEWARIRNMNKPLLLEQ